MKRRLVKWRGTSKGITIGETYATAFHNSGYFWDDEHASRSVAHGEWEDVCIPVQGVQVKPIWSGFDMAKADTRQYETDAPIPHPELIGNSGANGNYYRCTVLSKTTLDDRGSYAAEANDIIETLEMNFAEANAFKALWRKASARQGNGKEDHSPLYDAQKVMWSGKRLVSQETGN